MFLLIVQEISVVLLVQVNKPDDIVGVMDVDGDGWTQVRREISDVETSKNKTLENVSCSF